MILREIHLYHIMEQQHPPSDTTAGRLLFDGNGVVVKFCDCPVLFRLICW